MMQTTEAYEYLFGAEHSKEASQGTFSEGSPTLCS